MTESKTRRSPVPPALALGLATILTLAAPPAAEACSCVSTLDISHPCQSYGERSVVFLGRAVEEPRVRDDGHGWSDRIYRFAVEEPFAGVSGPTVEIVTGMGGGDCGVDFEVGRLTFVHAWYAQSGRTIVVSLCGTNSTRDLDSPDVAYGRALAAGDPGMAIFGRVTRQDPEPRDTLPLREPGMGGVEISVEGPDGTLTATTDGDGRFEIPGPLEGSFTVRARPPGDAAPPPAQEVEIAGGRCRGVDLVVPPRRTPSW